MLKIDKTELINKLRYQNKTKLTESDVDSCFGMMRAVI